MSSVSYAQARQLSHCDVQASRFEDLVTDNFLPLLPVDLIDGDCVSYPVIRDADKPSGIAYVSSGGSINTDPVDYGAQASYGLRRIVTRATVAGDILENVSQVHRVLEDQALAMAQLVVQKVGEELWATTPSPEAPTGMVAFASQNPNGVATPVRGAGSRLRLPDDLLCLRRSVRQRAREAFMQAVARGDIVVAVLQQAWSSGTGLVAFRPDVATGETMAHFADVPLVVCDHISLNEGGAGTTSVYLVRVGQGASDPNKIAGMRLITSEANPSVEIGGLRPTGGLDDEYFVEVSWNLAFDNRSPTTVARMASTGV